jgi:Na+-translocating ferredoxin:NAD+ oxidoreductase RnfG subunit
VALLTTTPGRAAGALLLAVLCAGGTAGARVLMTQDEALKTAFPPPQTYERKTLYLDDAQAARAAREAGAPVEERVVLYYVGSEGGHVTGYAYFDTHLVRTLPETVLIRLRPDGTITAIDIVAFDEPDEYRTTPRWLQQFQGQGGAGAEDLGGKIRSLSGATLSARAVTDAAKRIVALHRLYVAPGAAGK